jgi:hypothetical protein
MESILLNTIGNISALCCRTKMVHCNFSEGIVQKHRPGAKLKCQQVRVEEEKIYMGNWSLKKNKQ